MKFGFIAVLLLGILTLHAKVTERYYFTSGGHATFKSEAPLELITATTDQMTGLIDPVKKTYAFKIPIESFQGFNSSLQREHFNEKFLESEKYPEATFTGRLPADFDEFRHGVQAIQVTGELEVHGVKKLRTIPVSLFIANEVLYIESHFTVHLEDHQIKVPKIVYQKIASDITVETKAQMRIRFAK